MSIEMINYLFGSIAIVSIAILAAMWFLALYQVVVRKDLQEHKLLWIFLLFFIAPIGTIAYFFTEKRATYGVLSIVAFVVLVFLLPAYGLAAFASLKG